MRRTPLVAGGFLAGALFGALPPVQVLPARWQCNADGGHWIAELRMCEPARAEPVRTPADLPPRSPSLPEEER